MPTVRSFDAATSEMLEFEKCMERYLQLNRRSAVAYCGYACLTTSLPELVFAVVGQYYRIGFLSTGFLAYCC